MGVVQIRLPDEVQQVINRQVAEGRAAGMDEFLAEAARRYAADLDLEDGSAITAKPSTTDGDVQRPRRQPGALRGQIRMESDFDTWPPEMLLAMESDEE